MQKYVLGFMFDCKGERVVLIQKQHGPAHLVGKLNGVGGKVEDGESSVCALVREFQEETGVPTWPMHWRQFATFTDPDRTYSVACFAAFDDFFCTRARTTTDEPVKTATVAQLPNYHPPLAPNLMWLMHMALTRNITACAIER